MKKQYQSMRYNTREFLRNIPAEASIRENTREFLRNSEKVKRVKNDLEFKESRRICLLIFFFALK